MASDEEIQGSKDAVIQDLERKLRFKEDLLNNGQPVGGGRGRGHDEQARVVGARRGGHWSALSSPGAGASPPHLAFPGPEHHLTAGVPRPRPTRLSGSRFACGGESVGQALLPPSMSRSWGLGGYGRLEAEGPEG